MMLMDGIFLVLSLALFGLTVGLALASHKLAAAGGKP